MNRYITPTSPATWLSSGTRHKKMKEEIKKTKKRMMNRHITPTSPATAWCRNFGTRHKKMKEEIKKNKKKE